MEGQPAAQEIAVDLVADDPFIVFFTDIHNLPDLLLGPYTAGRIMGAAEYQYLIVGIRHFLIQIVKIDGVIPVGIDQRAVHDLTAIAVCLHRKWIINGTLDHNALAFLCQKVQEYRIGRHDSAAEKQVFLLLFPAVALFIPIYHCAQALIGVIQSVPEDLFIDPLMQGF